MEGSMGRKGEGIQEVSENEIAEIGHSGEKRRKKSLGNEKKKIFGTSARGIECGRDWCKGEGGDEDNADIWEELLEQVMLEN